MAFSRAGRERVNAFEVEDRYLFKHYFERDEVFERLRPYYDHSQYRFEVPDGEFETVQSDLADHDYALVVVDAVAPYVVVVEQYTAHPDNIFKASVAQRTVEGHNCFLLTDRAAVADATDEGARRLSATGLSNPFV
ncbi:MAG: hypothetical protein ABEJ08_01985 [Halobacteriaceae archaeon]